MSSSRQKADEIEAWISPAHVTLDSWFNEDQYDQDIEILKEMVGSCLYCRER